MVVAMAMNLNLELICSLLWFLFSSFSNERCGCESCSNVVMWAMQSATHDGQVVMIYDGHS